MFILEVESLSGIVKADRSSRGMSQDEYAVLVGVNGQTISNIETGVTKSMKLKPMRKLAEIVGRPVADLIAVAKLERGERHTNATPIAGSFPAGLSRKAAAEFSRWFDGGPPPSKGAKEEMTRELRKMERQGSMRGK